MFKLRSSPKVEAPTESNHFEAQLVGLGEAITIWDIKQFRSGTLCFWFQILDYL